MANKDKSSVKELEKQIKKLTQELNDQKKIRQREIDLLSDLSNMYSMGYFQYNYTNKAFVVSQSLRKLFENCVPDSDYTPQVLIENAFIDDKVFLEDLFLKKEQYRKISGQFRLVQRSRDYKETRLFQVNGIYDKNSIGEDIITCLVRDISKESKQVKELQRSLEKATEADKIKTVFLLNISHNIRTPMNSILGFAELLSMTDSGSERRRDFIQVIKKQSKNLLQLIDDIGEIAKYESGMMTVTKTPININLLISEIVRDIENTRSETSKKHIKIQLNLSVKNGLEFYSDAGRLHQVFMNLVNHSLKYTYEGYIELGYNIAADNKIEFYVKDTSQGIGKEELKSIFDKFGQISREEASRYSEETGLGLIIAKSIVKLLGGKLVFEPNLESGIIFSFSLPYEIPPKHLNQGIEDELLTGYFKWKDKVVLIVEDEEVNGLFLEAVFQETGAKTLYAKNGMQAIELCKSINKIDLILMDIKMPVISGIKATQEIRKFNQSIPIIAQTALSSEEDIQNCLLAGCNDTITKPIEVGELLQLANRYFSI
jgi:signal transduction histidine kinase/CheY-like chemotaxis protein